jgi:hypothetical protein
MQNPLSNAQLLSKSFGEKTLITPMQVAKPLPHPTPLNSLAKLTLACAAFLALLSQVEAFGRVPPPPPAPRGVMTVPDNGNTAWLLLTGVVALGGARWISRRKRFSAERS